MNRVLIAMSLAIVSCLSGQAFAQKGKPIVAIYQMDDFAKSGQAETFSAMIQTAVAATSKFRVMERDQLNRLVGEQARAKSGLVTSRKGGKVGGFEGADFLIYGSITTISVTNKADIGSSLLAGMFSKGEGPSCSNAVVTLGVDIKITDADSGEVKYVTRITETQKSAAACAGNAQVDSSVLLRSAAEKVASGLVTAIYPIQIASLTSDGTIVLNYGEGTITPGAYMSVYSKGASIIDPATGEAIGNDEVKLGLIRVTEVNGRISKAVPAAAFPTAPPIGSIVRPANTADIQALTKPAKKRK